MQMRIVHRLLPKLLYATFDGEDQACGYAVHLESLLAHGIVPAGLFERTEACKEIWLVSRCILECEYRLLFDAAIESGMRMRECYTLELPQVSLEQRTAFPSHTKNGDRRQVPLSSTLVAALKDFIRENFHVIQKRGGRLFPFWSGDRSDEVFRQVTRDVSREFANIFEQAGYGDIHFHDLRHEFICRLYERTHLTDVQIARITGHRDPRQVRRYASLRGSDLAPLLW